MDFVTDLPTSDANYNVFVVINCLTKMSDFVPCNKDLDARQFATLFLKAIMRLNVITRDITTDRGSQFTSYLWKEIREKLRIKKNQSTAFLPQTDVQTD